MNAFNKALALESIPDELKDCDVEYLTKYAKTVAYKVFHNIKNGHDMNQDDDPLTIDGELAKDIWSHHYE